MIRLENALGRFRSGEAAFLTGQRPIPVFVVRSDEFHDLLHQARNTLKAPTPHGLLGQSGEPALNGIEPA
jgi:hypothetical protein